MTIPTVELRHVRRTYPGVVAVDDVSLALAPGEIVGLVGPNGAGKSSVIKMLAGASQPESGEILVDGRAVALDSPADAAAHGLAVVHQELTDVGALTVAENIWLGRGYPRRRGLIDRRRLRDEARRLLAPFEAPIDPDALVGDLSIAERRLVMIAHALASDARVLVLDEPTASLTNEEIVHLHEVVRGVAAAGTAVVYVSHRLDEIIALTGRVVVMRSGLVVADVATAELDQAALIAHITGQTAAQREAVERTVAATSSADGAEVLRVRGLTKSGVVEDVSFAVHAGEVLGIAGLVGAGRTELMRLIYGADGGAEGDVAVDGVPVRGGSPRAALKAGIALLPEDRRHQGLSVTTSIRQNISLPSLATFRVRPWLPVPRRAAERRTARETAREMAVDTEDVERIVGELSGGNQQRVVLGKWLVHGARVFIFDEPTHGIDVGGKLDIYRRIGRLAAEGYAVIVVSSEFEELVELASRVLVLREGRIVDELVDVDVDVATILDRCYAEDAARAA